MKRFAALTVVALAGVAQAATTYNDSINDLHSGANGFGNIDIKSVTVSHDATNLYFTLEFRSSIAGTADWGKYQIFMDTVAGGRTDNAWGRNIGTGGRQNDFFMGSWVNGGGGSLLYSAGGAGWNNIAGSSHDLSMAAAGIVKYTISRAALGLTGSFHNVFFDVTVTGENGGDPGLDHLSNSGISSPDWVGPNSTPGNYLLYVIPTPGSLALLGMGGLVAMRRRR